MRRMWIFFFFFFCFLSVFSYPQKHMFCKYTIDSPHWGDSNESSCHISYNRWVDDVTNQALSGALDHTWQILPYVKCFKKNAYNENTANNENPPRPHNTRWHISFASQKQITGLKINGSFTCLNGQQITEAINDRRFSDKSPAQIWNSCN